MNEGIDIAFGAAKMAAKDNRTASIVVHGLSAGYNAGQIGYYRYRLAECQMVMCYGGSIVSSQEMKQYRWELGKHILLGLADVVSLFVIGLSEYSGR